MRKLLDTEDPEEEPYRSKYKATDILVCIPQCIHAIWCLIPFQIGILNELTTRSQESLPEDELKVCGSIKEKRGQFNLVYIRKLKHVLPSCNLSLVLRIFSHIFYFFYVCYLLNTV